MTDKDKQLMLDKIEQLQGAIMLYVPEHNIKECILYDTTTIYLLKVFYLIKKNNTESKFWAIELRTVHPPDPSSFIIENSDITSLFTENSSPFVSYDELVYNSYITKIEDIYGMTIEEFSLGGLSHW